ncbi:transcriptional regulator [uncultured Cohaesibacter sp.]|uniref:transcriptional regulator n=1 Tax=uncultured Cohaesibacter sp. TaxID=1002546 RepID=UPI00292D3ACA|nr:transcriptional regulator [uncultured Cohaesibacter sp.]
MTSIARSKAESRLAAIQKSQKEAMNEQEERTLKTRENISRLRALRLAKESEDRDLNVTKKPVRRRQKAR